MTSALSFAETKRVYDTLGGTIDWTKFYEMRAINSLISRANLGSASSVLEFGCGTGRLAQRLLRSHLPDNARYVGLDISSTMVGLAQRRLRQWETRAEVLQTDGHLPTLKPTSYDRFLSTFVFDLLDESVIAEVVRGAHTLLEPTGLLCLTSLSPAPSKARYVTSRLWKSLWNLSPKLVAGCRPIDILELLPQDSWHIEWTEEMSFLGLTSTVLVARPVSAEKP